MVININYCHLLLIIKKLNLKFDSIGIFSGTGAFASSYIDKVIITNDILYSNFICNIAWFSPENINIYKIEKYIESYNKKTT